MSSPHLREAEKGVLPGAEMPGGVAVVEAASTLVAAAPPRSRLALRLALRVLEWGGGRRRFSRLGRESATARLAAMEDSRSAVQRDVFLGLKALVCVPYASDARVAAGAGGVTARCVVAAEREPPDAEPPAPPLDPDQLVAPAGEERCDVVIVGSGAGGATVARVLAERGLDVIVIEQGAYYDARSYSRDPLGALTTLYREGGLTVAEGQPAIPLPVGRCVGGTTVINSGTCLRAPAEVLAAWRADHGIEWADDLDHEFAAVERALAVVPVDPATAGGNAARCRAGADALGVANGPLPRNAGGVTCCGTCPLGCELDAKRAVHVSELPRAVAAGARVRANAQVRRVTIENGRATGVRGRDGYSVRARAVVVAAGALGTPELLLGQGLANGSGALGRHLRIHPACWVGARFDEPVRGWDGIMQSWGVHEWANRGLFLEATFTPLAFGAHWLRGAGQELQERIAAYDRMAVIGVHLSERSEGRVGLRGGRLRVTYKLRDDDAETLRFGIERAAEIHRAAGAFETHPAAEAPLRLEAFHPMGTARIGADPATSVVAPSGETHGVPGLWIADASLFPTSLKVNPMLTIMACARRIAAQLADSLA